MISFTEGIQVKYKNYTGIVEFICNDYLTICTRTYDDSFRKVCMLVYPEEWKDIEIVEDYETEEK